MTVPPVVKVLLQVVLSGTYTPFDIRQFVHLCFKLALPLVRKKIALGKVRPDILRLGEHDIVIDCLADLFRRDSQGRFEMIESHFKDTDLGTMDQAEALATLRSLVFQAVGRGIIRVLSEADPVLSKVLRNTKLAVQKTGLFVEMEQFGETYLVPRGYHWDSNTPPMPPERMEQLFFREVQVSDSAMIMIRKLHAVLVKEKQYQPKVPFVGIALMFRRIHTSAWEAESTEEARTRQQSEDPMSVAELARLAAEVCKEMRSVFYRRDDKKRFLDIYIAVVQEVLVDEHNGHVRDGYTYYERLKKHMPKLTRAEYVQKHKKKLEYLAKSGKKRMSDEVKRVFFGSRVVL
ncbi:MAG: hypothetical protein HBSIN02_22860 [Bacteroidia bacterium]|nr:MAG: hypothetical protein HBSIN02_22860 [Bacteroidia bacterium]